MARRSNSDSAGCALLVLLAGGYWVYDWLKNNPFAMTVSMVIFGGAVFLFGARAVANHFSFRRCVSELVETHAATLTTLRKQLSITTPYGSIDDSKWLREVEVFIKTIIEPKAGAALVSPERARYTRDLIGAATASYAESRSSFSSSMDPRAYEALVADGLSDIGWKTRLTKGSGDQGVDVIAEMRERRVVIQCKRYQSPIGNTAVQEAYAGLSFEQADHAAVVSNAGFTAGARQISEATRVILLHHDELHKLEEYIFGTSEWKKYRELSSILAADATDRYSFASGRDTVKPVRSITSEALYILIGTIIMVAIVARFNQGPSLPTSEASVTQPVAVTPDPTAQAKTKSVESGGSAPVAVTINDPDADARVRSFCKQDEAKSEAACRRNEAQAWYRIAIKHEFSDGISQKCDGPPYPDSYSAKESCMRYELGQAAQ